MRASRRVFIRTACLLGMTSVVIPSTLVAQTTPQSEIPTSSQTMTGKWRVMNPTTFQLGQAAVLNQYDRVKAIDSRLTAQKRSRLEQMLTAGGGREVWVPDGIGLDYLTGRQDGRPYVYENMKKQIGRADRALLFDLGDGVYLYWFTGTRESCNNIGVVITPPPTLVAAPPPVAEFTWVLMPQDDLDIFRAQGYIPSIYIAGCCNNSGGVCSGFFVSSLLLEPGQVDSDPTLVRVRVPKPKTP